MVVRSLAGHQGVVVPFPFERFRATVRPRERGHASFRGSAVSRHSEGAQRPRNLPPAFERPFGRVARSLAPLGMTVMWARNDGDPKVEFAYDYMGRRVRKQVRPWNGSDWGDPVADRKYVWSSWLLLMELDGLNSDAMVRKYAWGLDLAGQNGSINSLEEAGGIGGLLAAYDTAGTPGTADDRTFVYFYDANGNVGQLVETTGGGNYGTLAVKYEYDPYGNRLGDAAGGEYEQPFRFSTKQFDAEVTELYYFGYRYYSPGLGRWVSRDPIETAGGVNLYQFSLNNPVLMLDPLGLCVEGDTCYSVDIARVPGYFDNPDEAKNDIVVMAVIEVYLLVSFFERPAGSPVPVGPFLAHASPAPGEITGNFGRILGDIGDIQSTLWYRYECKECKCGFFCTVARCLGMSGTPSWKQELQTEWRRCPVEQQHPDLASLKPGQLYRPLAAEVERMMKECYRHAVSEAAAACEADPFSPCE